ncbi:hypothetical protein ABEB36_009835 [Hypothenemus hampei]|uniref:Small ribosomal subunit protein mS23 n=1 Tax=Hypothenemus hampei TaxID=57062 RepID=A0ABD1EHR6_HYPHA
MAGSRLEKIGTIYSRASGLIQSKALNWEDRPLWYDIYAAFPPKEEPRFDRPTPNIQLKQIFYQEDKIRAIFHRNNKKIGAVHLNSKAPSLTQRFIETYTSVNQQYKDGEASEEQLYKEAIDILNRQRGVITVLPAEIEDAEEVSLSGAFKEAQKKQEEQSISIKDIFKD